MGALWRAWTETLEAPGVPRLFRHGDVLIQGIEAIPGAPERLPHAILAHGETTGHCHRLDRPAEADLYLGPEGMFLRVRGEGVSVVHEEHAPIHLPPGAYRVWRQREYAPDEIRIVRD